MTAVRKCWDGALPELRTDWLTERTVIVAEGRSGRPNEFDAREAGPATGKSTGPIVRGAKGESSFICPFCPGQEHRTPLPVLQKDDANGKWQIRVVPNLYPAVSLPADTTARGVEPALGAHEVIIETARHVDRTAAISARELGDVLETYAARFRHWHDDGRCRYGLVFKNQGLRAGASLVHLHSQLMVLPAVPSNVGREMRRAENEFGKERSCPYCRRIQHERTAGVRIVLDRDGFVAFCPYASWQPWEVWLLPAQHQPAFERINAPAAMERLADVLHDLVVRVEATAPEPRAATFAGLELAAGIHINPLSPEHAAEQLRSV
jgi:UDPglucose--hexose-1-phosphate uridylyltransferase